MPTSPTDPAAGGAALLVFLDAAGAPGGWIRLVDDEAQSGEAADGFPAVQRTILAVPGEAVAIHWLELDEGLTQAQAAAAARLMLADASAAPLSDMHVTIGRAEDGLTPAALVPSALMASWLAAAESAGLDPDSVVPSPLLLAPPQSGFSARERGATCDYRGPAAAFTLEPDLAGALIGDSSVVTVDDAEFEENLPSVLATPPLDLRQGPFARRRRWRPDAGRTRRIAAFLIALLVLTLAVQIATILSYTFAADRLEAEAEALESQSTGRDSGAGFGAATAALFDAVRSTPNVELSRLEYRPDGTLSATVMLDNPATLATLQGRLEASGLRVEPGEQSSAGGRPTADLTVGPA